VAQAAAAGVERIVTIGVGRASSERAVELAEAHPEVHAAVGVHPHDADAYGPGDSAWIRALAAHPKVVAIGECGLDYYRDSSSRTAQRRAFLDQAAIAAELGLPLVVHSRDATEDTLAALAEASDPVGGAVVLHCFSMPAEAERVAERGYYTSFAGQLTYPSAGDLQAAARVLPAERLLVETDAPYLAPVPRRGRPNTPANVAHTLRFLAGLRGEEVEDLDRLTTANAARAFGW
jgi:TatD DNase family protein